MVDLWPLIRIAMLMMNNCVCLSDLAPRYSTKRAVTCCGTVQQGEQLHVVGLCSKEGCLWDYVARRVVGVGPCSKEGSRCGTV